MRYAERVIIEHAAMPPFYKNGFVIGCEETREGVLIDPGDEVVLLCEHVCRYPVCHEARYWTRWRAIS